MSKSSKWLMAVFCFVLAFPITLWACQVPVFRYALEKWRSDNYRLRVYHQGKLDPAQQKMVDDLKVAEDDEVDRVNIEVELVDIDNLPADFDLPKGFTIPDAVKKTGTPWIQAWYPRYSKVPRTAWEGPLSEASVKNVIDTPARKEIAKKILSGDSAVWVFIKSGNAAEDKLAETTLRENLKVMESSLELPEDYEEDEQFNKDTDIKMKIAFSVIVLDPKNNKEEAFFISSLLNSEYEAISTAEPVAIPIFGRGRTYWGLVGKGISKENIADNCKFLTGPCGCEVKRENPGMDLIFNVNWDDSVQGTVVQEHVLPDLLPVTPTKEQVVEEGSSSSKAEGSSKKSKVTKMDAVTAPLAKTKKNSSMTWAVVGLSLFALMIVIFGAVKMKSQNSDN